MIIKDADIREYAGRDWMALGKSDRRYWADLRRQSGFQVTLEASQKLFYHMKSIRKDWPDEAQRRLDLDNHLTVNRLLNRIADALATGRTLQRP